MERAVLSSRGTSPNASCAACSVMRAIAALSRRAKGARLSPPAGSCEPTICKVPHQLSLRGRAWQRYSKCTSISCSAPQGHGTLQSSSSRAATPITGMATIFKAHHQGLPRPSRAWQPSKRDRLKADRWNCSTPSTTAKKMAPINSCEQIFQKYFEAKISIKTRCCERWRAFPRRVCREKAGRGQKVRYSSGLSF